MNEVSHAEAVELLRWMLDNPADVRGVRKIDGGSYGPFPFLTSWRDQDVEVSFAVGGGVLIGVDFVRIGRRFSNHTHWHDDPLDGLRCVEWSFLASALDAVAERDGLEV